MKAIREETEIADRGGTTSRRWYVNQSALEARGLKMWAAKKGVNFISIVPPQDPTRYFGQRIHVHYNIGAAQDAFLCPLEMKRIPCPICEERKRLQQDSEADQNLISSLRPTIRYLFFIVDMKDRSTAEEGVQLFDCPFTVQQGIIKLSTDSRTGEVTDISDPAAGKTVVFERTGMGQKDTRYLGFKIEEREPLKDDVLSKPVEFGEVLDFADEEEISKAFQGESTSKKESLGHEIARELGLDGEETKPLPSQPPRGGDDIGKVDKPVSTKEEQPEPSSNPTGVDKLEEARRRIRERMGKKS